MTTITVYPPKGSGKKSASIRVEVCPDCHGSGLQQIRRNAHPDSGVYLSTCRRCGPCRTRKPL